MNFADFRRIKRIFTQPIAKKGENFADFRQSKRIFTQSIAIKSLSFADFRGYDRIYTQPVAKKKIMYFTKSAFGGKTKRNLASSHWGKNC